MDILLSTDKHYLMPTGVTMKSVCVNNEDVTFHILIDEGVTLAQQKQLENIVSSEKKQQVKFYSMDTKFMDKFPGLSSGTYLSKATYYRLFIAELLPENVAKIIYMDGDVINTQSLKELWDVDMSNYAIGGVPDCAEAKMDFNRLGYNQSEGYFNAGVLLINVDFWRKYHLIEQFMDLIDNHPEKIKSHDQDVLNITLHDKKLQLPMKYNVQNCFFWKNEYEQLGDKYEEYKPDLKEAISNPVLIHFTANKKPWHTEDCNPLGYEWFKYYKQTEWKYQPLGHCNKSKIRYWGAKILRSLKLLKPALTDEANYYTLEEIKTNKL